MNPLRTSHGIGMTSARTRECLIQLLRDQGIHNQLVLEQIRNVPRHLFVDEALATRAYENTALPIGLGQTISQPFIVARMTEALFEGAEPRKVQGAKCGRHPCGCRLRRETPAPVPRRQAEAQVNPIEFGDLKQTRVAYRRSGIAFGDQPLAEPVRDLVRLVSGQPRPRLLDGIIDSGRGVLHDQRIAEPPVSHLRVGRLERAHEQPPRLDDVHAATRRARARRGP